MKKLLTLLCVFTLAFSLAIPALAEGTSGNVSVYTSHQQTYQDFILAAFNKAYPNIKVDIQYAGTGELLNKIAAESENVMADIMWGGGVESLENYIEYFEQYESPEAEFLAPVNRFSGYYAGFTSLPIVIMYNTDLVAPEEVPTGWEDLLNEKWKGKIAFCDPSRSGSSFTSVVTMLFAQESIEKGWEYMEAFVKNLDGILLQSSGDVYKMCADGEYPIAVTLESSVYNFMNDNKELEGVGLVYPKEGTSAVPDGVALIKGGPNADNAKIFYDFVLSQEAQTIVAKDIIRRPVRLDVAPPEGLIAFDEIPLVDYDIAWAAANKADILEQFADLLD